jgi:hypothetical protein
MAADGERRGAGGSYLLLRGGGVVWCVANGAVEGLTRRAGGFRVRVAGGALAADEVLGVAEGVRVRPLGGVVRRFWPEPAGGLAVHGRVPLVVIDPGRLPSPLQFDEAGAEEGVSADGEASD